MLRCLNACGFKEFGRNRAYYDFSNLEYLNRYRLAVASGFFASIENYHDNLLLCAEISHKLINSQNVFEILENIFKKHNNEKDPAKEESIREIVGQTVITL